MKFFKSFAPLKTGLSAGFDWPLFLAAFFLTGIVSGILVGLERRLTFCARFGKLV